MQGVHALLAEQGAITMYHTHCAFCKARVRLNSDCPAWRVHCKERFIGYMCSCLKTYGKGRGRRTK